jgi:alpha-L-rhamnosidase
MLWVFPASIHSAPPEAPSRLCVNDAVNPAGTGSDITFGWWVNDPDPNEIQSAYRILVATSESLLAKEQGDIWDIGKVFGRGRVVLAGGKLQSDTRYLWKVRTWDKDGTEGPWSEASSFSVGLLENSDWAGASWVCRKSSDKDDYTYYRRKATLPVSEVSRATVFISATHQYAIHINGALVGKGQAYHHPQFQYYNSYDVTPLLKPGTENQIAVFQHWFGGGQGRPAGERGMIFKAIIHHADGTRTELVSDGDWKQSKVAAWSDKAEHRNRGEGVGFIERIDARLVTPDWLLPSFDDSSWQAAYVIGTHPIKPWTGVLAPQATRITETIIRPASITQKGKKSVVDFGKVYAGMPRVAFKGGKAGETIVMRGGYKLGPNGEIDPIGNQATDMGYSVVLNGGDFLFQPVEYLGMRFLEIDNPPMPVTSENVSFVARSSQLDVSASSFESSDKDLDAVWDLMKHSLFTCAQEEFVDTPTREKGGFLGDGAIQSVVAMPVLHERLLTRQVLGEFQQSMEQHWSKPADLGRMNAVYPNQDGGRDIPDFTLAYLPWIWSYYMETGDRKFLERSYGKLGDIAGYITRHLDPGTGLVTNLTGGSGPYLHGIIDWPEPMRYGHDMSTTARTVINCWAYAGYDIMARIAGELGRIEDRNAYFSQAETLKIAINRQLINSDGVYVDGLISNGQPSKHASQHASMFPLALGIVPKERHAAVIAHVKARRMNVGMVTVLWLVRALGEADQGAHLVELFTHKEWDGWARCLARGATATWESWHSDIARDESMSHAWGAAGLDGYVRHILGIQPLKPGYEEVRIQPIDCGDRLAWAKGSIMTDRGPVSVHWKKTAGSYGLRVGIPVNATATLSVPRGSSARPRVLLDNVEVAATSINGHLVITGVGSGEHTITRMDDGP